MVDLDEICAKVSKLNEQQHIHIASLLRKDPHTKLNENNNGIMVNLSLVSQVVLESIQKYIEFLNEQESELQNIEYKQKEFKNIVVNQSTNVV
tara:strand:- start:774 stop:1052 length:279 start_codon:yes stop_codon:yes gene_type:complete